ncbi:MAG: DUF4124 domain-containing protein [Thiohalocapsa sp.]
MHESSSAGANGVFTPALLLSLLCITAGARAEEAVDRMYECDQDGTPTFSDQPCPGPEHIREVEYDRSNPDSAAQTTANTQAAEADASATAQADILSTEILKTEQQINHLQIERTARMAELREQRRLGSEDRDRAAWLAQMDQQMESVHQDYSDQITTASQRLNDLQARRAALGAGGTSAEPN